jgi:hypothetical protein
MKNLELSQICVLVWFQNKSYFDKMVVKMLFLQKDRIFCSAAEILWTFWPENVKKSRQNWPEYLYIIALRPGEIYNIRICRENPRKSQLGKNQRTTKNC